MPALDLISAAQDDTFAARTAMILMEVCINVTNEDPSTPNHANRLMLAQLHMKAEINTKSVAATMIASNATIQTTIEADPEALGSNVPDSDMQYAIGGIYDSIANAYAAR